MSGAKNTGEVSRLAEILASPINDSMARNMLVLSHLGGWRFNPLVERPLEIAPQHVRLEKGKEPVAVVELLAANISRGKELPFAWIKLIEFTPEVIPLLIKKCGKEMPSLLRMLGELQFSSTGRERSLNDRDVKGILKIADRSDDPQILTGALIALSASKSIKVVRPDLLLKLIGVDSSKAEFAVKLFKRAGEPRTSEVDTSSVQQETGVMLEVAKRVLKSPDDYAFQVVCASADFLVEHDRIVLPPLASEEEKLAIPIY